MSYLNFLNLMQAVKDLPAFPVMDALEERILNVLAAQWHEGKKLPVLDAMALFSDTSPATVHRRLKSFRAKGFIALQLDDKDNRVKYIVQTPQTRKYFAKIDECLHAARA